MSYDLAIYTSICLELRYYFRKTRPTFFPGRRRHGDDEDADVATSSRARFSLLSQSHTRGKSAVGIAKRRALHASRCQPGAARRGAAQTRRATHAYMHITLYHDAAVGVCRGVRYVRRWFDIRYTFTIAQAIDRPPCTGIARCLVQSEFFVVAGFAHALVHTLASR